MSDSDSDSESDCSRFDWASRYYPLKPVVLPREPDGYDPSSNYVSLLFDYEDKRKMMSSRAVIDTSRQCDEGKNRLACMFLLQHLCEEERKHKLLEEMRKVARKKVYGDEDVWKTWFITFNFIPYAEDTDELKKQINYFFGFVESFGARDYIRDYKGVVEYHGDKDNHLHFMVKANVFQSNTTKSAGKISKKLWELKNIKKLCGGKNFIEVKPFMDYHEDYIDLAKCDDKKEKIQLDYDFRAKYNIKDIYEKNA